jgi:hypothetical protein
LRRGAALPRRSIIRFQVSEFFSERKTAAQGKDKSLRLRELQEKRIAMGHKPDDHPDPQHGGWNMTMG